MVADLYFGHAEEIPASQEAYTDTEQGKRVGERILSLVPPLTEIPVRALAEPLDPNATGRGINAVQAVMDALQHSRAVVVDYSTPHPSYEVALAAWLDTQH